MDLLLRFLMFRRKLYLKNENRRRDKTTMWIYYCILVCMLKSEENGGV